MVAIEIPPNTTTPASEIRGPPAIPSRIKVIRESIPKQAHTTAIISSAQKETSSVLLIPKLPIRIRLLAPDRLLREGWRPVFMSQFRGVGESQNGVPSPAPQSFLRRAPFRSSGRLDLPFPNVLPPPCLPEDESAVLVEMAKQSGPEFHWARKDPSRPAIRFCRHSRWRSLAVIAQPPPILKC